MKPEHYTDEDLRLAILDASGQRSIFISTTYELEDIDSSAVRSLRTLLAHLPDSDDDWQECVWLDILHTDKRVRAEYISGTVIEGVPDGISDNGVYLVDGNIIPYSTDAKWYRIPAPVQHPDPAKHPVILDPHTTDDEVFDYAVWDTEDFYLCYTPEGEFMRGAEPSEITKFTPAKVVEDDR